MAGKRTKAYQNETIAVWYGIDRKTKSVHMVWESRSGSLSRSGKGVEPYTHHMSPGRQASTEIVVVFHLSDLFSTSPALMNDEFNKKRVAELEARAAALED